MKSIVQTINNSWNMEHTAGMTAKAMFYYIQSAGHFECGPRYITDRKGYNSLLLAYTLGGKGYLDYRGKSYVLERGDGFLIDCVDEQKYYTDTKDLWDFIWIHFNGCESRSYLERIYNNGGPVFHADSDSSIPEAIRCIHMMLKGRDWEIDILGSQKIVEILTELLLKNSGAGYYDRSVPEVIKHTIKSIEKNCSSSISLDDISKKAAISKYHFSRLFKKHTGYSPYEYVINCRMTEAKSMLKSTELPVCEISRRVGFESPSHFVKLFKKQEGITPLAFRGYWR